MLAISTQPMAENAKDNFDSALGRLVVDRGLATQQEVDDCLALQEQLSHDSDVDQETSKLSSLMVSNGLVTQRQIDRLAPQLEAQQPATCEIPGFKIYSRLGSGAMATVYKAKQRSLDRIVAIKVLPRKFMNNPTFVERFYAEGRAAAKLNHPNIVQAIDVGKAGDTIYFVMEYVEGRTVYADIVEKDTYSEDEALEIALQIAEAMDHAHQAGLIHRDVKPKNIMITKIGVAKLADMGLARAASDKEMAESEKGKAYGTPYYISPEQIRGSIHVDFRADIYSFGATLYHMVTGEVPFDGPTPTAVMHRHLKDQLIPPDHVNDSLSAGISEIIEVCMAKDPDKRYHHTSDLVEDLREVKQGNPPPHARKQFDLAALSILEDSTLSPAATVELHTRVPITEQPLFWVAALGWGATVLLMILLVVFAKS